MLVITVEAWIGRLKMGTVKLCFILFYFHLMLFSSGLFCFRVAVNGRQHGLFSFLI